MIYLFHMYVKPTAMTACIKDQRMRSVVMKYDSERRNIINLSGCIAEILTKLGCILMKSIGVFSLDA